MTAAMIDRLVHHSYLLLFDGPSYGIKNSLMKTHTQIPCGMLQKESAETMNEYLQQTVICLLQHECGCLK